jgi:hypothetical protein
MKSLTGLWWEDLVEREHLENLGVDDGIKLKSIIKKWDGKAWTGKVEGARMKLKMKSIRCLETSGTNHPTTRCNTP